MSSLCPLGREYQGSQVCLNLFSPERTFIQLGLGSIEPIELIPDEESEEPGDHGEDHSSRAAERQGVDVRRSPGEAEAPAAVYAHS